MKTAFITGATSGFGEAIARKFASQSYRLILTGRRADRLKNLGRELGQLHGTEVTPLSFDVRNHTAVTKSVKSLPHDWQNIDLLVNNAGLAAGLDLLQDGNPDDWDQMIDTNIKGLLYVTQAVLPLMTARQTGHIINIGSTASKYVYEKGNVYCATKFAVDALSQGMRIDLLKYHIRVTAIHPGAAETEFSQVRFKGDQQRAKAVYEGFHPLAAADIADAVWYCASTPPHVCISELVIAPAAQANPFYVDRIGSR